MPLYEIEHVPFLVFLAISRFLVTLLFTSLLYHILGVFVIQKFMLFMLCDHTYSPSNPPPDSPSMFKNLIFFRQRWAALLPKPNGMIKEFCGTLLQQAGGDIDVDA